LGVQPQNLHEHATQLIAEATALRTLEKGQRQKLPDQLFESFLNSIETFARKTRDASSPHEILDKLNQIHHIAKTSITDDITYIKNAVSHATTTQSGTGSLTWADRVRMGGMPAQPLAARPPTTQPSSKEREIIVKLRNQDSASVLRQKTPEDIRKRINDVLQANDAENPIHIVAAKQLKSGDIAIHAANITDADKLREDSGHWPQILGSEARILKPTYGVLVHGVRTDKDNIDPSRQTESIETIQTENSTLHPGAKVAYVGWLTRSGEEKVGSSLVVEFTTKEHADRAIREGLVLNACHHDCELYGRGCKLKQCFKCQRYGHIGPQCNANEICGYCAEPHNTRDCRKKEEEPNFTPKCALCKGPLAAWSHSCEIRQRQLAKVEQAKRNRPSFYLGPREPGNAIHNTTITTEAPPQVNTQRKRPAEITGGSTSAPIRERATIQPRTAMATTTRRARRPVAFYNFTQEDGDVFANNKRELERAVDDRQAEMRNVAEGSLWNGRTRLSSITRQSTQTTSTQHSQQPTDPRLIDPALTNSQPVILDE
jgi:hypothetical protein